MANFSSEVRMLSLNRTTWKQGRDLLASEKGLQLMKVFTPPALVICFDMEQFVLVPVSVYNNKSLNTQSITRRETPKYQFDQTPTYSIGSLKTEINKKFFARADSSVNNVLAFPRIKLLKSKTLFLDRVEIGVLLPHLAQQPHRKNENVPNIYFISIDTARLSPTSVLHQNAKTKESES